MKKVNLLSKAEMKRVMGGLVDENGKCYKCCPDGQPESTKCSEASGPGSDPKCAIGTPYETPCGASYIE